MIKAKKKFGQNFLIDQHLIKKIVNSIGPNKSNSILEIGPGLGALTIPLSNELNHIKVVEIDIDMINFLKDKIPNLFCCLTAVSVAIFFSFK